LSGRGGTMSVKRRPEERTPSERIAFYRMRAAEAKGRAAEAGSAELIAGHLRTAASYDGMADTLEDICRRRGKLS